MSYYEGAAKTGTWWQKHSLSFVLISIFMMFNIIIVITGWHEFKQEQTVDRQPVSITEFAWWFVWQYFLSLVADVFGAILLVILSKRLREVGSAEDNGRDFNE